MAPQNRETVTMGGVVVGRGAHLLTSAENSFRVRLEGSLPVCAERVAEQRGVKRSEAEKIIQKTNDERTKFVRKIYKKHAGSRNFYDMVINTDRFTPEQTVDLIMLTMGKLGFRTSNPKK
ncbi:MAG: cytidylate kinase-like family protein [Magnetococcales bacterium]|nr:cytidylate kinase-like family protein [Magnetococcales bacterium]